MEFLSLVIGIITYPIKWIWNGWTAPRPEITFEYSLSKLKENDYCHFRFNTTYNAESLFLRLGINNLGKKRIEDADVRIEKIEIVDSEGNRQKVNSSPFFLHWANENTDNSKSIYPKTPVFIDFLFTVNGRPGMAFIYYKVKHAGAGIKEFLTPGKWIVTVKLLGANISPHERQIAVDFNGVWDQLKMSLKNNL